MVADAVVNERGKGPNTMAGAENACQGRDLVLGLMFWCIFGAVAFVRVGSAVLPKQRRGAVFFFHRIDEAKPTTMTALTSSPNIFSYSTTLRSRGAYRWERRCRETALSPLTDSVKAMPWQIEALP